MMIAAMMQAQAAANGQKPGKNTVQVSSVVKLFVKKVHASQVCFQKAAKSQSSV
jgi:hypothetical protein